MTLPSKTSMYHLNLVVRRIVAGVAEHHAEVEGVALVQGVDSLNRGVQHLRRSEHHRRIDRGVGEGERLALLESDELVRRLLVGDVNVGEGEEPDELRLSLRRARRPVRRQEIGARRHRKRRAVSPVAVAELRVLADFVDLRLVEARQRSGKRDHPLAGRGDGRVDGIARRVSERQQSAETSARRTKRLRRR